MRVKRSETVVKAGVKQEARVRAVEARVRAVAATVVVALTVEEMEEMEEVAMAAVVRVGVKACKHRAVSDCDLVATDPHMTSPRLQDYT